MTVFDDAEERFHFAVHRDKNILIAFHSVRRIAEQFSSHVAECI
jgi:hypothetical protein